jgi:hypothetical protein
VIYVIDRGGDREKLLYPFLREKWWFMVRLVGNRNVVYRGELILASAVAARGAGALRIGGGAAVLWDPELPVLRLGRGSREAPEGLYAALRRKERAIVPGDAALTLRTLKVGEAPHTQAS